MNSSIVTRTGFLAILIGMMAGCGAVTEATEATEDVAMQTSELISTTNTINDGAGSPATQCTVEGRFGAGGKTTMHCCPPGRAMVGARIDQNVFKCATLNVPTSGAPFLDTGTQRKDMHSCPLNSVMVGLHEGLNHLACQALSGVSVSETVDHGTQDSYPMHVCGEAGATMSGIRIDQNKLNCATGSATPPPPPPPPPPTTSTVFASITVDVGSSAPLQGCGSASFLLDGAAMTFTGATLTLDSIYHCVYYAQKSGVAFGSHTLTVPDFNSCRVFSASTASTSVTAFPFQCF